MKKQLVTTTLQRINLRKIFFHHHINICVYMYVYVCIVVRTSVIRASFSFKNAVPDLFRHGLNPDRLHFSVSPRVHVAKLEKSKTRWKNSYRMFQTSNYCNPPNRNTYENRLQTAVFSAVYKK